MLLLAANVFYLILWSGHYPTLIYSLWDREKRLISSLPIVIETRTRNCLKQHGEPNKTKFRNVDLWVRSWDDHYCFCWFKPLMVIPLSLNAGCIDFCGSFGWWIKVYLLESMVAQHCETAASSGCILNRAFQDSFCHCHHCAIVKGPDCSFVLLGTD